MLKKSSILLMAFLLFFSACDYDDNTKSTKKDTSIVSGEFQKQLTKSLAVYFELKDALVSGDSKTAIEKGTAFKNALTSLNSQITPGDAPTTWKEKSHQINQSLDELINIENLMAQRGVFKDLSDQVISAVKEYGPLNMTVYVQHCPMAFDYSGGDWLSDSPEVLNPYYGKMMLRCGTVLDTLLVGTK